MPLTAGYSGKSLADKLGLKPGLASAAIHPPPHYSKLLEGVAAPGPFKSGPYNFIHIFAKDLSLIHI